ncbi:MAG TPA: respiratory nitrate reductase subunit gamma, partial [Propionibacteriaceae bacterium]|nr:respiratory nitrate reductase subunit gamma [Propionibacteriaceae bacterium]HBY23445.1 respiratory nitrate reductase subunit gamma [Propionibacteriaceae bacterium]
MDILLWGVLPYLVALTLIAGLAWRYRYDQFGWTTRSSQLYESKMLKIGSPLFHYGLFVVLGGHLLGLLIPKDWT